MCTTPIYVKNARCVADAYQTRLCVPCGKCPMCVYRKIDAWAFRVGYHLRDALNPLMVTLTYEDKWLPTSEFIDVSTGEVLQTDIPTLNPAHLSWYIKQLRNWMQYHGTKIKISYYGVGEYGTKKGRPHYHILIFNWPKPVEDMLEKLWPFGFVDVRPIKDAGSVRYIMKYLSKQNDRKNYRVSPFARMSKGIGSNYLTDATRYMHLSDLERCFITEQGGRKIPMPKYYKEKLYNEQQRAFVTQFLQDRALEAPEKELKAYIKNRPGMSVKQAIKNLRMTKKQITFPKRLNEVF